MRKDKHVHANIVCPPKSLILLGIPGVLREIDRTIKTMMGEKKTKY